MSKRFLHSFVGLDDLPTTTLNGKRHYLTPAGVLPSVTTVLGEKLQSSKGLDEWRARVGEQEADRITKQALSRGTAVHSICEKYIMNENYSTGVMPMDMYTFLQIKPQLDANLGSIYGIEAPLYSANLKTAGRTDLMAGWNGINSIIDFKTARKPKKEEYIESYFLQGTCYSIMAEERTFLKFPQIVIIIAVDHEEPQIFIKQRDQYEGKVRQIFR